MTNCLTKKEAVDILQKVQKSPEYADQYSQEIACIKICILAEEKGLNFWGKPVENIRPLFREAKVPVPGDSPEIFENYQTYQEAFNEAWNEAQKG